MASETNQATRQLVEATAQQILSLRKAIKAQESILGAHVTIPEVELLKTFTGISDSSAVGLMLEIQTIGRFKKAKNIASFFGVHPVFKTSGDGISGMRMSKQGRKEPRRILFMVTLTAIRSNPLIREIYQKHQERGKSNMAAIGVCMHKILRIIYGMLKHQTPFDPEVDINNRHRAVDKVTKPSKDKNRRFQKFDTQAPISRRQNKKRLEQEEPQCVDNTKCGVINPVPEPVS